MNLRFLRRLCAAACLFPVCAAVHAGDQPQWGAVHSRNMVSAETGLPDAVAAEGDGGPLWSVGLGDNSYGTPVVAGGRVYIGANNLNPVDARLQGDYGLLYCLSEKDGTLLWKLGTPRIGGDDYLDWPGIAVCSPPTVEGDRVYAVTNRYQIVCLDARGQENGNDGPYLDEGVLMVRDGEPPLEVTPSDADVIWIFDLKTQAGIYPHDGAHASPLLDGPWLYTNTCNGVDNTHKVIRNPDAPSLVVLDKRTGRLVARDNERIGPRIFHSTWSSPALGEVDGVRTIFFCGGDGVCYGFKALGPGEAPEPERMLERIWRFDPDPASPKENVAEYLKDNRQGPTSIHSMPVWLEGRLYITGGGDTWWGKREAWLKCVDTSKPGDATESGLLWTAPLKKFSMSTPCVVDGMVFVTDGGGELSCVDAATGALLWAEDLGGEMWGSALAADGKVYVGTRRGEVAAFAAAREKRLISRASLGAAISSTPVAANGALFVATQERIFAFGKR